MATKVSSEVYIQLRFPAEEILDADTGAVEYILLSS
jgi:hypothetical protein